MAVDMMVVKKPVPGVYVVSGLLVVGGLALVLLSGSKKGGAYTQGVTDTTGRFGPVNPLQSGEVLQNLWVYGVLAQAGAITVRRGDLINAQTTSAEYQGPGRDCYTYFRVVQQQGGQWVNVYGSGIAGIHVGPPVSDASAPTRFPLVAPDQPQPAGCTIQGLCAFPWPGPAPCPLNGASPAAGLGTVLMEIYEKRYAADADGFSSPTYNNRVPVFRSYWPDKIRFI